MSAEQTIARWKAEEEAVRARLGATAGYARPEEVHGRTGMQVFEAIFAGTLPRPPIDDTLDFVPIRIEPGTSRYFKVARSQDTTTRSALRTAAGSPRCLIPRWDVPLSRGHVGC